MKIYYLITKANWGGAQKYVFDLATYFANKECEVAVMAGEKGVLTDGLCKEGVKTIEIKSLGRDISFVNDIRSFFHIIKILIKDRPDVVHVNSSKAGGIGALAGRLCFLNKVVFTVHGAPFRENVFWLKKRIMYIFTWITCLLATDIICVSLRDAKDISSMPFVKNKVKTIYNGLDYSKTFKREGQKNRNIRMVSIGELHRNKGYSTAILATKNLHTSLGRVTYDIFGDGEDRLKLEELISLQDLKGVVNLLGHDGEAREKIKEYDIFLLPSVKEGLPYVLLEAGVHSLPVVASITGGVPEIIKHEATGLLVPPGDVKAIVRAVNRLDKDRNLARKLGSNLRAHLVSNFSSSKMLAETAIVYGYIRQSIR